MTREAKIGMLTGLGVIVLIGVLLSNYLGDPHAVLAGTVAAGGAGMDSSGRMAPLPVGAPYRQQVMAPISVPAMSSDNSGAPSPMTSPLALAETNVGPLAYANDNSSGETGPSIRGPVTPVAIGPTPLDGRMTGPAGAPPTIVLAESGHPTVLPGHLGDMTMVDRVPPATTSQIYVITAGDTLSKIAKKFYNSTKNLDLQRIVAANPGILKDTNTVLVQGKKLTIPNVPGAEVANPTPAPVGVIPMPGAAPGRSVVASGPVGDPSRKLEPPAASPKKDATKIYVVQSGDTLQKIARKLAPGKVTEMVQKLSSMNGIKDPDSLQAGMHLKVPDMTATPAPKLASASGLR